MGLQETIVELYGLAPGEFVAARNNKARELRVAGDRDTAAVVAKLRRPSANQWALNMAQRSHPDIAADWIDAVAAARDAQEAATSGKRVDLREALATLRTRTAALIAAAAPWSTRDDLGATLNEIAASVDATSALGAGVLGAAPTRVDDGDDVKESTATAAVTRSKQPSPDRGDARHDRLEAASREVERATAVLDAASDDAAAAAAVLDTAQAALTAATDAVEASRSALAEAETARKSAERETRLAERESTTVMKRVDRAHRAHDAAVERLSQLTDST